MKTPEIHFNSDARIFINNFSDGKQSSGIGYAMPGHVHLLIEGDSKLLPKRFPKKNKNKTTNNLINKLINE